MEQMIIIYTDPTDNKIRKYTTAYDSKQCEHYILKCVQKHGLNVNPRAVPGKQLSV